MINLSWWKTEVRFHDHFVMEALTKDGMYILAKTVTIVYILQLPFHDTIPYNIVVIHTYVNEIRMV